MNYDILKSIAQNTLILDLASMPGGVDKNAAKLLKIKVIHALGLPGKMAPYEAAIAIKNVILNLTKERTNL